MSDQAVNVTIGAKIDELISSFKEAASAVQTSAQSIASGVGKSMGLVEQSSNEATAALRRTEAEADSAGRGIMAGMGNISSFMSGVLGPVLAGFSMKAAVDTVVAFADKAEELGNTAQIVGTTATAISRLHASAEPLGITAEAVNGGMKKLAKTMVEAARGGEEQAAALDAIGLSAQQVKSMSIEQVLAKISDKFQGTEDGATKSALAMALMGRSGADLIPWLNQGSEEMRRMADEAEAMGAVMGEDAVAAGSALDDALDKVGVATTGLKNMFSQAFAPVLQFIAECFTDGSGAATDFGAVFKGVATIVIGATTVIRQAWAIVSGLVRAITVSIASILDAIVKAVSMDWSGAKAALQTGDEMVRESLNGIVTNYQNAGTKASEAMAKVWGAANAPKVSTGAGEEPKGQLDYKPKEGAGNGAEAAARKQAAEAKAAAKEAFEYQMEMLRNEMAELDRGSVEKLAVARRMVDATKEMYGEQSREYARAVRDEARITEEVEAEKRRIRDQALTAGRERATQEIALEQSKADYLVATGQMTAVQRAQVDRNAAEQQYAMDMAYLEQRLALYAMEPQERERINQEIERMKGEHLIRMQNIDTQQFEVNKAQWSGYFQVISDGFANAIQGMVFQGQTLEQAMGNILQNVLGQIIQTGVKMMANWAATQLGMTSATVTGAAVRTAAEVTSAKTSTAANAGAAIKNIMTKAVEVFANVYNAIAGIPYVGPFLAPVMAVAAGATIVGLVGKVASAEGGWDRVPYDGARAILHKEEMVLPAPLAEGIRSMVEGGNTQRGGGVTIHALDRRDVARYFDDNSDQMVRALMQHGMNNPGGF